MNGKTSKLNVILGDEEKVSVDQVNQNLLGLEFGTAWAEKTNGFAIKYIEHLTEVYGDSWYKGFLPEESFWNILLPKHGHSMEEKDDMVFFPIDTPLKDAVKKIKEIDSMRTKECLNNINYLKEEIKRDGFTSNIVLVVINNTLKHVDGLHRLIAYAMLLEEGQQYKSIPVFLCDNTRGKE